MPEFVRVRDKETGHEYSVRSDRVTKQHEVVDKRAVDANGRPLPAKPRTSATKKAAAKSTSKTSGGEPAENPEEGSK